jgi:hypothetical protein
MLIRTRIHESRIVTIEEIVTDMAQLPDYEAQVEAGGITHTVRTYCDRIPETWEGTCAAYHKKQIQDLIDAYGGVGGGN